MAQPIWSTASGSIGSFPSLNTVYYQLSASPVLPATSITYSLLSGILPPELNVNTNGLISGIPNLISNTYTNQFVVRATDNLGNIADRTFSMTITGTTIPTFATPNGNILTQNDSVWIEIPIEYNNPIAANPVVIHVVQGLLPPGLEINPYGIIRGYANPPITIENLPLVITSAVATNNNAISVLSTTGFRIGRPVVFTGTVFGNVVVNYTYYVKSILSDTLFTISSTINGPEFVLTTAAGFMVVTLPDVGVGQPSIETFSFTLRLDSPLGSDIQSYSITIVNQNTPVSQGGPGYPSSTRAPTIYNTRPATYNITDDITNYGYYVLPPNGEGNTYLPSEYANIGIILSDNNFDFHILGHDFDNDQLTYVFADLPLGLYGDSITGWISGNPIISPNTISKFNFSVSVRKTNNPNISTPFFNFTFTIENNITGTIDWLTPDNLGIISNGTLSNAKVEAIGDVSLQYRIVDGSLPPNLTLLDNGEISGKVSYQPTDVYEQKDATITYTFTVQAYSPMFPVVQSNKVFTWDVYILFGQPTDTLYMKCTPSTADRNLINSLLTDDSLIPNDFLYRPLDPYYGKATSVVYEHAYGIYASNLDEYIASVTKNHYWRQITLGEIKIANAIDEVTGDILYQVVYSEVVDNLVSPEGVSVGEEITWPRPIPLFLGPWYTSETNIYDSYEIAPNGQEFYTSLTPGFVEKLYPNSLPNMRNRVGQTLGVVLNYNLLPTWMTTQQVNGSTLGFTPAWVIAYVRPGVTTLNGAPASYAEYIQYQIQNNWKSAYGTVNTLNQVNFKIDRFTVDKSMTYDYDNGLVPPAWTALPSASPTPDPLDSQDFYVLFPRQNILPDKTQY